MLRIFILIFLAITLMASTTEAQTWNDYLKAVAKVESGGCRHPDHAVGDGGRAIGRYQIHKVYWQDAIEFDPSIGGRYEDCRNPEYAARIMRAYARRYAPEALKRGDWQHLARLHNGGPAGPRRAATKAYAAKVMRAIRD